MTTLLATQQERINAITNDLPGTIVVSENPAANPNHNTRFEWASFGRAMVARYEEYITAEAVRQGVDPGWVKAIVYLENSHGYYDAMFLGFQKTIRPMNIDKAIWAGLLPPGGSFANDYDNIYAGIRLIKGLADRIEDPTFEKVASLYNATARDKVADYGALAGNILQNKTWESNSTVGNVTYVTNSLGQLRAIEIVNPDGTKSVFSKEWTLPSGLPTRNGPLFAGKGWQISEARYDSSGRYLGGTCYAPGVDPNDVFGTNQPKAISFDETGSIISATDASGADISGIVDLAYNGDGTASDVPRNLINVTTTTDPLASANTPTDPTQSVSANNATLISTATCTVTGVGNVNTATGNQQAANAIACDNVMPAAREVLNLDAWANGNGDYLNLKFVDDQGAYTNQQATGATRWIPVDPLVVDLNGDGVKLTSFGDAPVLFDIDHDGKKELTGWTSSADGIVVMDLNGNGKIDDISETMSEYFNGAAGADGNAGEKKYANGFAALKALDSNADNAFTSADAAWNNVKIWQDANHDGLTDAGELKTLAELNITRINLASTAQSGLVNGGNEILATASFTQNGATKEAQAARFIANPIGNTLATGASGTTVTAEDGQSTYVSSVAAGESIDVAAKGVKNAYGSTGNDTLIGDANANWLVGGQGCDTFNAGAGDDMLIIDAADQQQNIHAGDGFDMVQVVGQEGVTLNLAQAEVEVAVGGQGDDILIGGGRSSVFVRAGDGADVVIGGAANDALSGENGNDLIDGGAGNDIIRGGRGQDQLMGGAGDDLVEGGLDDDRLSGGSGDDILTGGQGDDVIDGGDGVDIAQFSGNLADYRITRLSTDTWRVVDTKAGRDGADMLTGVEKFNFVDVSAVDLTLDNPFPVKDVLTIANRNGLKLINVSDLLANDRDWQSDALHITTISDLKGGSIAGTYNTTTQEWTPTLTSNGEIQFTPDPSYTGVMSFKYKIADADGTPGAQAIQIGTNNAAEMRGQVYLKTPDMPADGLFTDEWYLNDINALPVWNGNGGQGYTGKGVKIGQFEPGMPFSTDAEVFNYRQPDLQANADSKWMADPNGNIPQTFSEHATLVAGVMVAARDGLGAVGVAYDAKLSGYFVGQDEPNSTTEFDKATENFKNFDVVNNSWGIKRHFSLRTDPVGALDPGIESALRQGRNGLGTAIVVGAGNDRASGANTNYSLLSSNRGVIVTAAINAAGDISTLSVGQTPFSNPGASILVSAPGSNIASTSNILTNDDGTVFGSDTSVTQGTSFATPVVSGVVALMLEANPKLGWRDIQQILAITAKKANDPNTDAAWNGAANWNSGGMHTSHDYGFGKVEARAAVRLAETWTAIHVSGNERHLANGEGSVNGGANLGIAIGDGAVVTRTLAIGAGLKAEHVTISLDVAHSNWGDLTVELISPTGTVSKLIANPGSTTANPGGDVGSGQLAYALDTTHDYGENAQGNWQLRITDRSGRGTGTLNGWKVDVYGSDWNETSAGVQVAGETPVVSATADNTYFYTDEFTSAPGTARSTLADTNGGIDTLNASAVSGNSVINLNAAATSTIAGRNLTTDGNIEFAFGGDGNDAITGNAGANELFGGRGDDRIDGGAGSDLLDGGGGADTLTGGAGGDFFVIRAQEAGTDTITDFTANTDRLVLLGMDGVTPAFVQQGADTRIDLGNGRTVILSNVSAASLSASSVLHAPNLSIAELRQSAMLGTDGNDTIYGSAGSERLYGGRGNDLLLGDPTNTGLGSDDFIDGGAGDDELIGGAGNDTLIGGQGQDYVQGDAGKDTIYLEGDSLLYTDFTGTNASVRGNGGADTFVLAQTEANGDIATNFIWDFELGTVGSPIDRIDLSRVAQATDFAHLAIVEGNIDLGDGQPVTEIQIVGDPLSRTVTLYGIHASQLRAEHFVFASGGSTPDTGLVSGTSGSDTLTGDAGADIVDGGSGADKMTGRTGDDTYIVDNPGDTIVELPDGGFDTVKTSVTYALPANVENLVLSGPAAIDGTGNDLANRITGNAAANVLDGGAGPDTLLGGTGNDTYIVDNQSDSVIENAGEGTDTVKSSVSYTLGDNIENLTLTGTDAVNATGNALANVLTGNAGDNVLDGAGGADVMAGGAGDDTYLVDNGGDVVTENANEGIDTVYASVNSTLGANVENLVLAWGATTGTGNELDNSIVGNDAANTLTGGAGNDTLDGGAGADTMIGGTGDDSYVVDSAADVVTENANEGNDTIVASVSIDLSAMPNIENVMLTGTANLNATGNASGNRLVGNAGNNTLTGAAGEDTLDGGGGADTMIGGTGDDTYVVDNAGDIVTENAGEGIDTVYASIDATLGANVESLVLTGYANLAGTGNGLDNTLTGNAGDNVLAGGAGNDTYRYDLGGGHDVIVDSAGTDRIVFGAGIAPAQIVGSRSGSNAVLNVSAAESIAFSEAGPGIFAIESIEFADGTIWHANEIRQVLNSAPTGTVAIAGTATQNQVLTASNTLSDTDGLGTVAYQWQSSQDGTAWSDISGATASTFTLAEVQVGKQVRVVASYTDGHGTVESKASAATTAVVNVNDAPTGGVTIAGTATQNQVLTAANTLADADGLGTIAYQWQSSPDGTTWSNISGATAATFTLAEAQVGKQVRVVASYIDGHGIAESKASAATAAVANVNDAPTGSVMIAGTATQNHVLTAANTLADADGLGTIAYQWQSSPDGTTWSNISGATASTFTLTEVQVGKQVRVVASYTDGHGTGESVSSAATTAVANVNDAPTGSVTIAGTATQNEVLTAANTLADVDGLGTIAYQWQSSPDGTTWSNISGATAATFTLAEAQVGKQVRVVASYTDGHGTAESKASAATTMVANVNDVPTGSVTITGTATQNQVLMAANTLADPDGLGTLAYQWQSSADGLAWNPIAGATDATFTLTAIEVGLQIRVIASYTDGHGTTEAVASAATGDVIRANQAPTLAAPIADQRATEDAAFSFTLPAGTFADPDAGDVLTFSAKLADGSALPAWLAFDAATGTFSGTPPGTASGLYSVSVTATDKAGLSVSDTFVLDVANHRVGTAGTDTLTGTTGRDLIEGGAGNDILNGGAGADTLVGGLGNDSYMVDNVGDVIVEAAGEGADTIYSTITWTLGKDLENLTLQGTAAIDGTGNDGNNTMGGNAAANVLTGGAGNDWLNGNAGADTLIGGLGNDSFVLDNIADVVVENAGEGIDTVYSSFAYALGATLENLTLQGTAAIDGTGNDANNQLTGNAANNTLTGGLGNDTLDGGAGADTLIGGLGDDTYVVDNIADVVVENTGEGTDTAKSSISYTVVGTQLENLALLGNAAIDGTGNDANNTLSGNAGANVLSGGAGNDWINGNAGADTLIGGQGNDSFQVDNAGDVIVEAAGEGTDTVYSVIGYTLAGTQLEHLMLTGTAAIDGTGNDANNQLTGNAAGNTLTGGLGNDTLDGGAGADTLIGGLGNDKYVVDNVGDVVTENAGEGTDSVQSSITYTLGTNVENLTLTGLTAINGTGNDADNVLGGGAGANVLSGGAGNDWLDGGAGADTLIGGLGNDTFVLDTIGDVVVENAGEGNDAVQTSFTYTLGANVEKLTLTGTAAVNGTGNELNNVLAGNSAANVLLGGAGRDTLSGGAGNDVLEGDPAASGSTVALNDLVVYARGTPYNGGYPTMEIWIDGVKVQAFTVDAASYTAYAVTVPANTVAKEVAVVFSNDEQNRDLYVDRIEFNGQAIKGNDPGVIFDYGTGAAARDDFNTYAASYGLWGNGAMRFSLAGSDSLDGGAGVDTMRGGVGNDFYTVDDAADVIVENANEGHDLVRSSVSYVLSDNIEDLNLTGTANLTGTGNAGQNMVVGNTGNNRLDGGAGKDLMVGSKGDDTYVADNAADVTWEVANEGTDTVESAISWTLQNNTENLTLTGTAAINGTGNELSNVIIGNSAANALTGNAGNDTLDGGAGNDTLMGGAGSDVLIGGVGDDTYRYDIGGGSDVVIDTAGTDTIFFGSGITAAQITGARSGTSVVLNISATDAIAFEETSPGSFAVESLLFGDGAIWGEDAVRRLLNSTPTGAVSITGTPAQNQVLTATNTLADLDGLGTIAYQWQSSADGSTWADISGATASTFTLAEAQVGKQVRVVARYTDGHGTAESMASAATAAIAHVNDAPTGSVTVSGTATQNQVLTAANTLADVDGLGTIAYQWQSSIDGTTWNNISGATSGTFTLAEAQVGKQVRVVASYTDGYGTAESKASAATAAVANVNDAPTGNVAVSGTATQNQILTASNTLADGDGLGAIGYQWQSSPDGTTWSNIIGATAATFTLTEGQVGKQMRVVASYADGHGTAESKASAATAAVANVNDVPTGSVAISGTAVQNQILTASNMLADADGLGTITYQWQSSADGGSTWGGIGGATASTLALTEAQVGKLVRVNATYTDGHGTLENKASASTIAIANVNDAPTGIVTVSGMAVQNQVLTITNTLTDIDGLGIINYQWQSSSDGTAWSAVGGATGSTLMLTEAQVGKQVRGTASYTDGHGGLESVASAPTAAIVNVNDAPTGAVTVSGITRQDQTLIAANNLADIDGLGPIGYQWQSSTDGAVWSDIAGARASSFILTAAQVNMQVRAVASYIDGHGTTESVASGATPAVIGSSVPAPALTQTLAAQAVSVGAALSFALPDDLFGSPPNGFTYSATLPDGGALPTWLSFDANARRFSGTPTSQDDSIVAIKVTAKDAAGASSSTMFEVLAVAPAETQLGIYGLALQGQSLTALGIPGRITAESAVNYRWQTSSDGTSWTDIAAANGSSITLQNAQAAQYVRAMVSYVDSIGVARILVSQASPRIAAVEYVKTTPGTQSIREEYFDTAGRMLGSAISFFDNNNQLVSKYYSDRDSLVSSDGFDPSTGALKYKEVWYDSSSAGRVTAKWFDPAGQLVKRLIGATNGWNSEDDIYANGQIVEKTFCIRGNSFIPHTVVYLDANDQPYKCETYDASGYCSELDSYAGGEIVSKTFVWESSGTVYAVDAYSGNGARSVADFYDGNGNFSFHRGDGRDTIFTHATSTSQTDTLNLFDVNSEQLWFKQVGQSLEIDVIGTSDSVTVDSWFAGSLNHVQSIRAADGKTLTDSAVSQLVQAMAAFTPPPMGQTTLTPAQQQALAPVLAASWH